MLIRIHRRQDRLLGTSYQTEHAEHIEHMSMLCAALQNPQINPTLGHFDYIEHRTDPTLARDQCQAAMATEMYLLCEEGGGVPSGY